LLRQALNAARRAGAPAPMQREILQQTMDQLRALPPEATPPEMAERIHRMVRERTAHSDPYHDSKGAATREAVALLPRLRARVEAATDPLEAAVRIAIAGNIIDHGVTESFDLEATLERVLRAPLALDGMAAVRGALAHSPAVLYLADNAGETVFDRVLIERLRVPVTYAVKAGPVLNDATAEDARAAGIDALAEIVDTGSDAMGTPLALCSEAFRRRLHSAPVIIAKGQANYETLSAVPAPILFLLQAKCQVIAEDLGVEPGSVVIKAAEALDLAARG
jgi:uncharacterized protein with ATP-grasp and redox domains